MVIIIKLKINKYKKQGYLIHKISKNKHCLCKILNEYDTIEEAKKGLVEILTGNNNSLRKLN